MTIVELYYFNVIHSFLKTLVMHPYVICRKPYISQAVYNFIKTIRMQFCGNNLLVSVLLK